MSGSEAEYQVRLRVKRYLADREAFEQAAARCLERTDDEDMVHFPDGRQVSLSDYLRADYIAFNRAHLTRSAFAGLRGPTFADPPTVSVARTVVLKVSIDGLTAVVMTDEPDTPWVLPPHQFIYLLEREEGEWRLAGRRKALDNDGPDGADVAFL